MKASEMRAELLQQHDQIRIIIGTTRAFAERARAGAAVGADLRASLVRVTNALRVHNLHEETMLRDVIHRVDAWGPVRADIMTEEHIKEHARLYAALLGVSCTPIEFAGIGVASLLDLICEHMDREEAAFLGEEVLRDDLVVANQSSG
jgi:hypothetical protein